MKKREKALASIRFAGYHQDQDTFMRTYIINRISYKEAQKAYKEGVKMKEDGMKCSCSKCNQNGQTK